MPYRKNDIRLLAFTRDRSLLKSVAKLMVWPWKIETCFEDRRIRDALSLPHIKVALIDDGIVAESERGWILEQVRTHLRDAHVIYLAAHHSHELECKTRARGVLWYTSHPLEMKELTKVLREICERALFQSTLPDSWIPVLHAIAQPRCGSPSGSVISEGIAPAGFRNGQ